MHALVAVDQPNITTWNGRRDVTDGMLANLEVVGVQRIIEHLLVQLVNQQRWLDDHTGQHRLLPSPTLWSVQRAWQCHY